MTSIITRAGKGTLLTPTEADTNYKQQAVAKTSAYQVIESDNRDTIECSGTFPVTITSLATLLSSADTGDFQFTLKNSGTGIITYIDLGGSLIDGLLIGTLYTNQSVTLKGNAAGNGWNVIARVNERELYKIITVNTGTSVELTADVPAGAKKISMFVKALELSSVSSAPRLQLGNSVSYITTGYVSDVQYIGSVTAEENITTGLAITGLSGLSTLNSYHGAINMIKEFGTDVWSIASSIKDTGNNVRFAGHGYVDVTAPLTRMTIDSAGFDGSGTISLLIE